MRLSIIPFALLFSGCLFAQSPPSPGTQINSVLVRVDPAGPCTNYNQKQINVVVNPPREWVCVNSAPNVNPNGIWVQSNTGGGGGGLQPPSSGTNVLLRGTTGSTVTSPAVAGTDYAPATSGSSPLKGNGAGGTATAVAGDFPTLNQSTTGNAATATALATTPTLCSTGQAPTGINAGGNAVACAALGTGGLADPGSNSVVYRTSLNTTAAATSAQVVPLIVLSGSNTPSSCTVAGQYFQNTTDKLLSVCNGSVYNSLSAVTYNIRTWGAKCDGSTDDTTAISAWATYVKARQYGVGYVPAGICMYNGPVIQWPSTVALIGDSAQTTFLVQNHATHDLFMLLPATNGNPTTNAYGSLVTNISFAGRGATTTGNLFDDLSNGRHVLNHVGFWANGGIGYFDASERGMLHDIHWTAVRTALYTSSNYSTNETYVTNFTAEDCGCARDAVVGGSFTDFNYNVNASAGTFPGSGSIRQDQNGAFDLSANVVNFHLQSGSIKSTHCIGGILIRGGQNVSLSDLYVEGFVNGAVNPSIVYGGPHQKSTTSASLASGATTVELTDGYHFPHLSDSSFFSNLQSGAQIDMLIRPPDFLAGSSAASSLGGGILRGSFEYVGFNAVLHDGTGSGWHGSLSSRGRAGTTALTWPAGAIFQETWGDKTLNYATTADALHLVDNHLNSVNTYTGYTVLSDTAVEQTSGEIVLGYEPDLFYVYGGPHSLDGEQRTLQFTGNNRMLPNSAIAHNIQTFGYTGIDFTGQVNPFGPPLLNSSFDLSLEMLGSGVVATAAAAAAGEIDGIGPGYWNKFVGHPQGYSQLSEFGSLGALYQVYPSLAIASPMNASNKPDWLWTFGTASTPAGTFTQKHWNGSSYDTLCTIGLLGHLSGGCTTLDAPFFQTTTVGTDNGGGAFVTPISGWAAGKDVGLYFGDTSGGASIIYPYSSNATMKAYFGVNFVTQGSQNVLDVGCNSGNIRVAVGGPCTSMFNVGSSAQYQVSSTGNIVKLNNVTTSFPSANATGALTNDGSGNFGYVKLATALAAPTASVSGVGCAVGTAVGNGAAGTIPVTGTGAACAVTLTYPAATFTTGAACSQLVDFTSLVGAFESSTTTSTVLFASLAVTNGDNLRYGPCAPY